MRIGLLAAFCGGLAWAHNQEVFAAAPISPISSPSGHDLKSNIQVMPS
jgi:hypothetical protein